MDDDRFIIDLRDLELGFSVWQVCMCVYLNSTKSILEHSTWNPSKQNI